jgi:Rha family phage regulatory protein
MKEINIIQLNGVKYLDSRDVAELIGRRHDHLLRDIRNYVEVITKRGIPEIGASDFFIESSYQSAQNKEMPCFLISKLGAEMISNKVTGEKGILFTAVYVAKFNEMEMSSDKAAAVENAVIHTPRLGEYNAASRLIVFAMRNDGATASQIMDFLRGVYEPLGFMVITDAGRAIPNMYTAYQIAEKFGVYSLNGKPHFLAVSSILSSLNLADGHKSVVPADYGNHIGVSIRYDEHAVSEVGKWLNDAGWPETIKGEHCVYRVTYPQLASKTDATD